MATLYKTVGWTNTGGKPPGTINPMIDSTVPINGPACVNRGSFDVSQDIAAIVQPKYETTRDMLVPYSAALKDQASRTEASHYFGSFYTSAIVRPPGARQVDLGSWRRKPRVPWKEYQRRKSKGEILLNRLDLYAASATVFPGVHEMFVVPQGRVWYRRSQVAEIPRVRSIPCNKLGYSYASQPDVVFNTSVPAEQVYVVMDTYYIPNGSNPWWVPSEREVWDLALLLQQATEVKVDPGLVTATLAEANNKNLDVLTNLGELPETARWVIGVLKTILNLVKDFRKEAAAIRDRYLRAEHRGFRKGGLGADGELMTDLSSLWLQYRYAIMPLVYSIEDALGVLLKGEVEYRTTRKKLVREILLESTDWHIPAVEVTDRCFVKHRFEYDPATFSSASNYLTTNPLLTLWELTTLSFVVDWVLNIGDLLASLDTPPGVTQEAAMFSTRIKDTVVVRHKRHLGAAIAFNLGQYNALPIQPQLHIGLTASFSPSWFRAMDGIALLWGDVKRVLRR